jgi:hypothetical protein
MRRALAAVVLTLLAAGCSSSPPARHLTPSEQIGAWADSGGQTRLQALMADENAFADNPRAAEANACFKLRDDTNAARAYKPLPDTAAEQHWAASLNDLSTFAKTCIAATADGPSSSLWDQAGSALTAAQTESSALHDRLAAIVNGHA